MLAPLHATSPGASAASSPLATKLRGQAQELEGVFLNTLVKEMFASIGKQKGFNGGFAEETWRGMQAEQYAGELAQNGGIGLADALVSDLLAVQQTASITPASPKGEY